MTPQEIISDDEIARVHGNANFGAMDPREVVNDGVRKTAVGYHCGSTQLHILRDHGLVTKPRPGSSDADLTKKGKAYARSIYRDTTPARAEAQDEGAAGEASAYRVRMISNDPAEWVLMHPEKALDFLSRKGWESQPLYAHPSPTPAADADADRVREKAAFVQGYEDGYSDCSAGHDPDAEPNWTSHLEALAALKSTAAKEGGA